MARGDDLAVPIETAATGKLVPEVSEFGPRLRAIRLSRGVGLRELARRIGLSPSSISQIETGKLRPSVSTLYALASEFDLTVDGILFAETKGSDVTAAAWAEPELSVQRTHDRPAIQLNSGVVWERLMFWADEDVEFIEATYAPGGQSSSDNSLVQHKGHEFGHMLSGRLRVFVGANEYVLEPGDSITFPSSMPHRLSNDGSEVARALWVVRGRRGAAGLDRRVIDTFGVALETGHRSVPESFERRTGSG